MRLSFFGLFMLAAACAEGTGIDEDFTSSGAGGSPITGAGGDGATTSSTTSSSMGSNTGGSGGTAPGEQACPPDQFATGIDGSGTLQCAAIDASIQAAVNAECSIYLGWRDDCNGCALAPAKWGRVSAGSCANGLGSLNTCTTTSLGNESIELFGLNLDGDMDDNDKFYSSFHCTAGDSTSAPGPCAAGALVTDIDGTEVTCTPVSGAALDYLRNNCSLYVGWRDGCNGCTTAPSKWGRADDGACTLGTGTNDTCTTQTLGTEMVRLFGLNTDGDVDDNDKFYVGMRCVTPTAQSGSSMGPCPLGQFVTGIHADGSLECTSPTTAAVNTFRNQCTLYFGWNDGCNGCGTPPVKWGRSRDGFCQNGAGSNNTCTATTLGADTVNLFGLNTDGNVDDNDTFYVGFRCL
jgi:hypothetical protein